jgi:hypothetical protein
LLNTLIAFLLSHFVFSVFEVRECLARWQRNAYFFHVFKD